MPGVHAFTMMINRFRSAAAVLIGFNILGTILTWVAELQKPGIGAANAIAAGTQFTGPLIFVMLGAAALALTFSGRRILARIGAVLLAIYGAGFAVGEISELFQRNVGISPARWDVVLAGSVIGALIGLTCATYAVLALLTVRRPKPAADRREDSRAGAL
jgi:hypothetical protein